MKYKGTGADSKSLESYKIFPYVAWTVTFGFVFFVYNIALELQTVTENLQRQTSQLQQQMSAPGSNLEQLETEPEVAE